MHRHLYALAWSFGGAYMGYLAATLAPLFAIAAVLCFGTGVAVERGLNPFKIARWRREESAAPTRLGRPSPPDVSAITVDTGYLHGLFKDLTSAQIDAVVSDYIGHTTNADGPVSEVAQDGDITVVCIGGESPSWTLTFLGKDAQAAKFLHKGSEIHASGRIRAIDRFAVFLVECHLISSQPNPRTPGALPQ